MFVLWKADSYCYFTAVQYVTPCRIVTKGQTNNFSVRPFINVLRSQLMFRECSFYIEI